MVTKLSMRATFTQMEVGEVIAISLAERGYNSIRNCASNVGVMMARKYSVRLNREANECKVTRTA